MAEAESYTFSFQELTEALIRQQGITDGYWQVVFEFGIGAVIAELPMNKEPTPAAVVPINKIGIQKVPKGTPLAVDAADLHRAKLG
jgi:hypothetical protein